MPVSFDYSPDEYLASPAQRYQIISILKLAKGLRRDDSGGHVYRQAKGGHDLFARVFGSPLFVISGLFQAGTTQSANGSGHSSKVYAIDVRHHSKYFRVLLELSYGKQPEAFGYRATAIESISRPVVEPLSRPRSRCRPVGPNDTIPRQSITPRSPQLMTAPAEQPPMGLFEDDDESIDAPNYD